MQRSAERRAATKTSALKKRSLKILSAFAFSSLFVSKTAAESSLQCEGSTNSLVCAAGTMISVKSASYGRTQAAHVSGEPVVCPHSATSNRNCHASSSAVKVEAACEGKASCSIASSNGVFGDPCGGTYKYLNITYDCVGPSVDESEKIEEINAEETAAEETAEANEEVDQTSTVCEHSTLNLSCKEGDFLKINTAVYGRSERDTCKHSAMSNINCAATRSMTVVGAQCEGLNSCAVAASNGVFGDPCGGTYKYLTVNYDCVTPNDKEAEREAKAQALDPFKGKMILTTGCSPLELITFQGETFSDRVGAKIITKSMDPDFKWNKAMEMTEVYCGTYAVDFTPQADEEFGFYLYDKLNPDDETLAVSDIGCVGDATKCPVGDILSTMASCTETISWNGATSQHRVYKGDEMYSWGSCEATCALEPEKCPSDITFASSSMLGKSSSQSSASLSSVTVPQASALLAVACFGLFAVHRYRQSKTSSGSDNEDDLTPLVRKQSTAQYNSV